MKFHCVYLRHLLPLSDQEQHHHNTSDLVPEKTLVRPPSAHTGQNYSHCKKRECIPVGCILPAHLPYARVCFSGGCTWSRGVHLPGGVPGLGGWVWSWGVYLVQGVYLPGLGGCIWFGGYLVWGCGPLGGWVWSWGVYLPGPGRIVPGPGGGHLPGPGGCTWCWGVYLVRYSPLTPPPPWTEFLTHASEIITLRAVIIRENLRARGILSLSVYTLNAVQTYILQVRIFL